MQTNAQDTSYFQHLSGTIFQVRLASLPGLNDPLDPSDHNNSKASIIDAPSIGTQDLKKTVSAVAPQIYSIVAGLCRGEHVVGSSPGCGH